MAGMQSPRTMPQRDGLKIVSVNMFEAAQLVTMRFLLCVANAAHRVAKIGVSRLAELQAKTFSADPTKPGILVNAVSTHTPTCMHTHTHTLTHYLLPAAVPRVGKDPVGDFGSFQEC